MNKEIVKAFCDSVLNVMPMLGIADVVFVSQKTYNRQIEFTGVIGIIGIIGEMVGNVFFAMNEDSAKKIASYMMCGMEVLEFNELAQSAISELSNMLAANASIALSESGKMIDISTPTLMNGEFTVSTSFTEVVCLEMLIDNMTFNVYLSIKER